MGSKRQPGEGEWTTYSYSHLYNGVFVLLKRSESDQPGGFYLRLSAMVMCAFSLEAHLNHLGPLVFDRWDEQVRKGTSVETKFKLICSKIQVNQKDFDQLQDRFRQIVRFRNKVAHATTESRRFKAKHRKDGTFPTPGPEWEKNCTKGTAKKFQEWTKVIIQTLNKNAGLSQWELFTPGESSFIESHGA